jgi:hypothetical protein
MTVVSELRSQFGVAAACQALAVPRSSFYRSRQVPSPKVDPPSPLTLRAEPLPPAAKAGLALGAVALVVLGARVFRRDSRRDGWRRSVSRLWG